MHTYRLRLTYSQVEALAPVIRYMCTAMEIASTTIAKKSNLLANQISAGENLYEVLNVKKLRSRLKLWKKSLVSGESKSFNIAKLRD